MARLGADAHVRMPALVVGGGRSPPLCTMHHLALASASATLSEHIIYPCLLAAAFATKQSKPCLAQSACTLPSTTQVWGLCSHQLQGKREQIEQLLHTKPTENALNLWCAIPTRQSACLHISFEQEPKSYGRLHAVGLIMTVRAKWQHFPQAHLACILQSSLCKEGTAAPKLLHWSILKFKVSPVQR